MKTLYLIFSKWVLCLDCCGTGVTIVDWNSVSRCIYCDGKGWVRE